MEKGGDQVENHLESLCVRGRWTRLSFTERISRFCCGGRKGCRSAVPGDQEINDTYIARARTVKEDNHGRDRRNKKQEGVSGGEDLGGLIVERKPKKTGEVLGCFHG